MTTPIKPLADRVVAVREVAATKTASGIYCRIMPRKNQCSRK